MRWSAEAPVTWPSDAIWQRAWSDAMRQLAEVPFEPDGRTLKTSPGDPAVALESGTHLQPGAAYRIAPELTTGALRGWVASGRAAGVEWAPHRETGRAHVEVHGLDRIVEVRAESTLTEVTGHGRLTVQPGQVLEAQTQVPWLRAELAAWVEHGRIRVDLRLRGLGVWWPTLAPLFAGFSSRIQQELDSSVTEFATSMTNAAATGTFEPPARDVPTPEQRDQHYAAEVDAAVSELARRQHLVDDAVRLRPWWRRTRNTWRQELANLPPALWPSADVLVYPPTWEEIEGQVTARVLAQRGSRRGSAIDSAAQAEGAAVLEQRRAIERDATEALHPLTPAPWLTDSFTDLSWLASPWSVARHLMKTGSDDEAREAVTAMAAQKP